MEKERLINVTDNHQCGRSRRPSVCFEKAVLKNDVEHVNQMLLSGDGDVNLIVPVLGGIRMPAVYYAVLHGNVNMVETLCKHGADVGQDTARGGWCHTPLTIAVRDANVEIVRHVCEGGANVDAGWAGHTILMLACKRGSYPIVEQLLRFSPQLNVRDSLGNTALHIASMPHFVKGWDNPRILKLLLAQTSLEYDVKNANGQTPIDLIFGGYADLWPLEFYNNLKVLRLFVHTGFSVNQEVLCGLLSAMDVFMHGIACNLYDRQLDIKLEDVRGEFCAAIEMCFAAGCSAGEREVRVMTSECLSPLLKLTGIQAYAFRACSRHSPGSLKRTCKLSVRHHMRKPIRQNVQMLNLPGLLSTYIVLDRNDLDWTETTSTQE